MLQVLSDGMTSNGIPEPNSFIPGRAREDQSIWGKGERAYPAVVACPRLSDLFSRIGVPTANCLVVRAKEPAAIV